MSKDKSSKKEKKTPASKADGKDKHVSAYKSESKSVTDSPIIPVFGLKTPLKTGGKAKN